MNKNLYLSVVSPVYRAEMIVDELVGEIHKHLAPLDFSYEIILVVDGSPDHSWDKVHAIAERDEKVTGIKLSRNFGQHYAITAGLEYAQGEWIVVMDCDLQDHPSQIQPMLQAAKEGDHKIVMGRRAVRKDGFFKKTFSKLFYAALSYLSGSKQDPGTANFGVYHQSVVAEIRRMKEPIRFFPSMVKWVGFSRTSIDIEHFERFEGKSSYNLKRLFRLALDIILANSDKPLRLTVKLGLIISSISFLIGVIYLVRYLLGYIVVSGFASIIISIWFLGGFILLTLGIVGLYISKIFEGVKNRPIFIVDKIVTQNDPKA